MAVKAAKPNPLSPSGFFNPDEDFNPGANADSAAPQGPPQAGALASAMPPSPSTTDASGSAMLAPAAGSANPSASVAPSANENAMLKPATNSMASPDDFMKANMPARPVGELDNVHGVRRGLAFALAGLGKFGSNLIHEPDDQLERWTEENLAQRQYDANQGRNQAAAKVQGSGQNLAQQGTQSEINLRNAEAQRVPFEMHKEQETAKANAVSQILQEKESGKYSDDILLSRWQRIARANPTLGLQDQDIQDAISGTKAPAPVFKSSNGTIEPLTYQGKSYGLEPTQGEPPEVSAARQNAIHSLQIEQLAKLNPIVRGQLGEPPSDPKQLADDMKKAEAITTRMSAAPRIEMQNYKPVQVADPNTGAVTYERAGDAMENKDMAPGSIPFSNEKAANRYFTTGAGAQQKVAFDTAIGHLNTLEKAAQAMGNGDVQALNKIGNELGAQMGSDSATNFNAIKNVVAGEVAKAVKGNATEGEMHAVDQMFSSASSPQQIAGVLKNVRELLATKREALQTQRNAGVQGKDVFSSGPPPAAGGEATATGKNGHKIAFRNRKWVDAQTGQAVQ